MTTFCPRCGQPAAAPHPGCAAALALEPPRFCELCARRLRVQVYPDRFEATCPDHGRREAAARGGSSGA